jgi:cystathionine gamma-synthase
MFNGRGDVIAGSLVVNSKGRYAEKLRKIVPTLKLPQPYYLDACVLELNSRDFVHRSNKINDSALKLAKFLEDHPCVERVYHGENTEYTAAMRRVENMSEEMRAMDYKPGYGCLMSVILKKDADEKVRSRLFYASC